MNILEQYLQFLNEQKWTKNLSKEVEDSPLVKQNIKYYRDYLKQAWDQRPGKPASFGDKKMDRTIRKNILKSAKSHKELAKKNIENEIAHKKRMSGLKSASEEAKELADQMLSHEKVKNLTPEEYKKLVYEYQKKVQAIMNKHRGII